MAKHYLGHIDLTQEIVRELLAYDRETGKLFWNERAEKWSKPDGYNGARTANKIWNTRYANKEAFTYISKSHGYPEGAIFGKGYLAHRIIWMWMKGCWPIEIDHINRDRTDNRWENLREATRSQNARNIGMRSDNKTGVRGVSFSKQRQRYVAMIGVGSQNKQLGAGFKTLEEATIARKKAEKEYEGYD